MKNLELIESHYEALLKLSEEEIESDDQSSPTIDGSDRTEILDNLQGLSDPSKVVLDIIQNPIFRMGDDAVFIGDSHILLLEQLMRISPHIEPHVREEAMKLALDLKSNISENTENSSVVVGFLLLLSIYGLAPSFDRDEVYKLFGFAAKHKITVELFGTLGFADKASDFVKTLIMKKQHIEAARFVHAYIMPTRIKPKISCIQENQLQ
ncbi:hypothetical protein P8452_11660 [Trifolium repens]|nr:hypothetical protein P8452_11660 [Trifolium repens]